MPDRTKGPGQTKFSPWSSRLEVGRGARNPTPEKSTATKPPEPLEDEHGRCQDPNRIIAPAKKEKKTHRH
jgi:hypothetical protein